MSGQRLTSRAQITRNNSATAVFNIGKHRNINKFVVGGSY
jgi:hypothetical protein